jgi:DNA-binding MarR family transcriptional regulator
MVAQREVVAEIDRTLQSEVGISKAEFSVLRTLQLADDTTLRVGDLGASLRWEKSRVSHLLSRMEERDLVIRSEDGAPGRRTAVSLSQRGRQSIEVGLRVHEASVRRLFIDRLTGQQAEVIGAWSEGILATCQGRTVTQPSKR